MSVVITPRGGDTKLQYPDLQRGHGEPQLCPLGAADVPEHLSELCPNPLAEIPLLPLLLSAASPQAEPGKNLLGQQQSGTRAMLF